MNTATIEIARHFLHDAPAEAASMLESLPARESAAFLNHVPVKVSARILLCLSPAPAASILSSMQEESASNVFALLNPNQIASLIRMSSKEQQLIFLKLLPEGRAENCQKLLNYPEACIGAHALNEVPLFSNNLSVDECLTRIKTQTYVEADTIFVNDTENRYLGALKLSALLRMPGKTKIDKLPRHNTFQLSGLTPLSTAFNLDIWSQRDLVAVVDAKQFFVGSLSYQGLRRSMQHQQPSQQNSSALLSELGSAFTASMLGLLNEINHSSS